MGLWDRLSRRLDELSEEFLPDGVRASVEAARELVQKGDYAAAVALLEEALREKPDHATALYLLGVAELRRGRAPAAESAFARARDARASFVEAAVGLGEAKLVQGDAADGEVQGAREADDFFEQASGLAQGAGGEEDEGVGIRERVVEGFDGSDGGLTPLAAAADYDAVVAGGEDILLEAVDGKFQVIDSELGWGGRNFLE